MPKYKDGEENKYFPTIAAALLIIAIAISAFVASLIRANDPVGVYVNPDSLPTPSAPPNLPEPEYPPE